MALEDLTSRGSAEPWMRAGGDGLYLYGALYDSGFSETEASDMAECALALEGEEQTNFMRKLLRANGTDPDIFDQL